MSAPKKSTEKSTETRAEINRENAQKSTGPKTEEGKAKSSQNRFKHGVYSKQVVAPGEDPAELDELRGKLRDEHQPANTTEASTGRDSAPPNERETSADLGADRESVVRASSK